MRFVCCLDKPPSRFYFLFWFSSLLFCEHHNSLVIKSKHRLGTPHNHPQLLMGYSSFITAAVWQAKHFKQEVIEFTMTERPYQASSQPETKGPSWTMLRTITILFSADDTRQSERRSGQMFLPWSIKEALLAVHTGTICCVEDFFSGCKFPNRVSTP